MNIAFTIDELNEQPQTSTSPKRGWAFAYWILLAGILSGFGALALATVANARP
jgi:hypothetical protein